MYLALDHIHLLQMDDTALYVQLASEILLLRRVFPPLQQQGASKWDTHDISAEAVVKSLFDNL